MSNYSNLSDNTIDSVSSRVLSTAPVQRSDKDVDVSLPVSYLVNTRLYSNLNTYDNSMEYLKTYYGNMGELGLSETLALTGVGLQESMFAQISDKKYFSDAKKQPNGLEVLGIANKVMEGIKDSSVKKVVQKVLCTIKALGVIAQNPDSFKIYPDEGTPKQAHVDAYRTLVKQTLGRSNVTVSEAAAVGVTGAFDVDTYVVNRTEGSGETATTVPDIAGTLRLLKKLLISGTPVHAIQKSLGDDASDVVKISGSTGIKIPELINSAKSMFSWGENDSYREVDPQDSDLSYALMRRVVSANESESHAKVDDFDEEEVIRDYMPLVNKAILDSFTNPEDLEKVKVVKGGSITDNQLDLYLQYQKAKEIEKVLKKDTSFLRKIKDMDPKVLEKTLPFLIFEHSKKNTLFEIPDEAQNLAQMFRKEYLMRNPRFMRDVLAQGLTASGNPFTTDNLVKYSSATRHPKFSSKKRR